MILRFGIVTVDSGHDPGNGGHVRSESVVTFSRNTKLHTNSSETDIRDYVKKRKISGGTRSDLGRQCRDTFASLKKTCRMLKVSFWDYLIDRVSRSNHIPPLPQLPHHHHT